MTDPPKPVLAVIGFIALAMIAVAFYVGATTELDFMSGHTVTAHGPAAQGAPPS